jgi:hypothetical protein
MENEIEFLEKWYSAKIPDNWDIEYEPLQNLSIKELCNMLKNYAVLHNVSVSLPTKDEVSAEGYRIANDAGYNYRRVLRDQDHDIYYSGWMDCFDWISKGNER